MTLILAVDDKHENLYYLRVLLSAKGFTVVSARHGAEALALARANPPDLVISDLLMPVMDGYTLLRHWKADARLKKAPFIVYTATYTEEADEQLAYSLGADAFILKPAEPDDFLARLAEVQARAASAAPLPPREPTGDETARLKVYSETLIRKLEEKTLQLEEANRALKEDISRREAADLEIKRANRALTMLGACNEALIRATEEDSLLQDICRIVVDVGGYRVSAVGLANDDKEKSITIRAHTGDVPPSFLQLPRSWATGGEGSQAPAGRAIRSGEALVIEDVSREPALRSIAADIKSAGIASGVYLPLKATDGVFGVLTLFSAQGSPTNIDELKLLRELSNNLSFGIGSLRSRREREKADSALRASLREQEALLKEVHHRVKNNMQVITSLLRLESNRIGHDTTRGVLKDMQNRIQSMAALHETLYQTGNFACVDLGSYLKQVSTQLVRSMSPDRGRITLHLELTSVGVVLDQAIPCGLIVNELVSNAFKHGFPEGRTGGVWVESMILDSRELLVRVRDDGVGLPDGIETVSRSLGLQLVSDLARQLQGRLIIGPGSSFEVRFQLSPTPRNGDAAGD